MFKKQKKYCKTKKDKNLLKKGGYLECDGQKTKDKALTEFLMSNIGYPIIFDVAQSHSNVSPLLSPSPNLGCVRTNGII